ncbi:acyl carrier protein [Patescibacteria group bacterium]|nr:MAG: acyl carrier protein [Patescibacteria group bacterium]
MDTLGRIKRLFKDNLDFEEEMLLPPMTLESLGLDSLDKVEFIFALENEFSIRIPERGITITTIQDVVDLVDRLVAEQQSSGAKIAENMG